jgi:predicted LPLAT superfamily acyltransferase
MPPVYGGFGGDVEVQDIGGYVQQEYVAKPYTYTLQPGIVSGIDTPTTFTGQEARRVESYVTGVAQEYRPEDFQQPKGLVADFATTTVAVLDPIYGTGGVLEPVTVAVDPTRTLEGEYGIGRNELLLGAGLVALLLLRK